MALAPLAALVRKDLQIFFTDRRAVILTLAIPIAIASFFGSLFQGQSDQEAARVAVAMVDQDGSGLSKRLIAATAADKALAVTQPSLEEARAAVLAGRLGVAVVIPAGFGDTAVRAFIGQGKNADVELLTDPSKGAEVAMVRGLLTGHVMGAVTQEAFSGASSQRLLDEGIKSLETNQQMPAEQRELLRRVFESVQALSRNQATTGAPAQALTIPFDVRETQVTGLPLRQYNGYAHSFAGMGIQFALFAGIELAAGILLERERGLWKRLRSAPLSRSTLLVARAISGTCITLLTLLVSFAFARIVFQAPIGNMGGFLLVTIASSIMAATFGLLVAALGHTPAATRRVAMFVVLVMVMLGGAWVPSFLFPAWLQQLTWLVPVRWAVDGLDAMTWRGLPFAEALVPTGLLLAVSVACGALALWRFRWEEA
jgi:ABC-2 type transport system permease protein